ncbi:hypothetical protein ACIQM3_07230 [Streptomyces sp. NPDC091271]|uniref:hypothetical protein n=1 Tax=Streptomyces sp. NPDC091271 TaxID=3365980 RepID=UPI0038199DDA
MARVVLFGMAGIGIFSAFQFMAVVADGEWSDDELSSAVSQATAELDGTSRFGDIFGDDSGFDEEFATMIEEEVVENGGGGAPQDGWGPAVQPRTSPRTPTTRSRPEVRTQPSAYTSCAPRRRTGTTSLPA